MENILRDGKIVIMQHPEMLKRKKKKFLSLYNSLTPFYPPIPLF